MKLRLRFRDLDIVEVSDMGWSGGAEHLRSVADAVQAAYAGAAVVLAGRLDNDRPVALGIVDFAGSSDAGVLSSLVVHERLQSLGIGTRLVRALEQRIVDHGRLWARLTVELDNPRAAALYRRLGYREVGPALDSWPVDGGRTYVAACTLLERPLSDPR
jgi:ribosomal protein S18 acetylase RimI-like enzyme